MQIHNHIELRSYQTETHDHAHDFAQLVLPLQGSMEIEVGHYSGIVDCNIGIYIAPNERHYFAGSAKNLFLVVDIKNHFISQNATPHVLHLTPHTKQLIQFTHDYLSSNERDYFADSLLEKLLFHFVEKSYATEPDQIVIKAKNWIELHYAQSVELNKIAQYCHLSVSQLQRRFKQQLDCSIGEYWRLKKLQQAKLLLIKGLSIESAAFAVGYENLSAFSRRFSDVFDESPSQWRSKAFAANKMRRTDN